MENAKKNLILAVFFIGFCSWGAASNAAETQNWEQAVDRAAKSVLAIRVDGTRAFDTGVNNSVQATGFVIDAKRGIVLTNRHVVQPGPVVAKGIFLNREEVKLTPIYRDPIHDFGFFQYDPKALSYNKPIALKLAPERVQLGREIRVIGNDGGEQLSILAGTIARLDRPAPNYGPGSFNDFNTFYIQAATSTSGGSSGAPVIDLHGNAIALNAGANTRNAASFFLPLDRIVSAYEFVIKGKPIPRGTLQTTFQHQPYDELRRLGLSKETEKEVRQQDPKAVGLLTVEFNVPAGPADEGFEPGDILLKINGQWVRDFVLLESILDHHVNKPIIVTVERGGKTLDVKITVQDLNSITPSSYVEVGGAILHNLSYQQARNFTIPVSGVYVAYQGYIFGNEGVGRGSVITTLAGKPVKNLADVERILKTLADGERFPVRYFTVSNPRQEQQRIVTMDRRWFSATTCHRDDQSGLWPCTPWPTASKPKPLQPNSTDFVRSRDPRLEKLAPSLVVVDFDMPYPVEGISDPHYTGSGLIIDAKRGWVMVDRQTVPSPLGDVRITFAGSLEIPGKVEFIHPLHNVAIVSYDPALIGSTPVKGAEFSSVPLKQGDDVWLVGPKMNQQLTAHKTTVLALDALRLPIPHVPRFRENNLEVISLTSKTSTVGGVLTEKQGKVAALWAGFEYQQNGRSEHFFAGIPAETVQSMVERLKNKKTTSVRSISTELHLVSLAEARKHGLPDEWANRLEKHNPEKREVLVIIRVVAGSPAAGVLKEADLLLAIDGNTVTSFREVENAANAKSLKLTVLRQGQVKEVNLKTEPLPGQGLDRIINWAGAILHRPQRAIAEQRGLDDPGLYISWVWHGSPAAHYALNASSRIIELEGYPVTDIDSFLKVLKKISGRESVRLKVLSLTGQETALTLNLDNHYWPTVELVRKKGGWQRRVVD